MAAYAGSVAKPREADVALRAGVGEDDGMLALTREVVRIPGPAWDDDDDLDLDLDDEAISEPRSDVCGGVTNWDGFDLGAVDETAETNHLGSASLEIDQTGRIISYEEYYPYGGTSFIAGGSQKEVGLKEYRYTGKERDDSTGFYYHGARYFAPWTGRWMSADPAGPVDGLNLYEYVSGNPVRMVDPEGMQEETPQGHREWVDPGTGQQHMEFWFEGQAQEGEEGPSEAEEAEAEPTPAGEPSAEAAPAAVEVFIPSPEDIERREATIALLRRPSEQARRQVERTTTAAVVGGAPAIGQMTVAVGMLAKEGAAVAGPAIGAAATKAVEVTTAAAVKATAMATAAGAAATAALQRIAQPAQRVFQALQGRVVEAVGGAQRLVARFDPLRVSHIFRDAAGHVNPASAGSQARFVRLFESVASNSSSTVGGKDRIAKASDFDHLGGAWVRKGSKCCATESGTLVQ